MLFNKAEENESLLFFEQETDKKRSEILIKIKQNISSNTDIKTGFFN